MTNEQLEIKNIIDRETKAWDTKNIELLLTIFHEEMVWPWPKTVYSLDPMNWELRMGKFNTSRWASIWQDLFDNYRLVHNIRKIKKIELSNECDGAFAVVDIDTLWINQNKELIHWKGRTCKIYTKTTSSWKLIMQTGVLKYH